MHLWKSIKRIFLVSRLWKCRRKSPLKQFTIVTGVIAVILCLFYFIMHYCIKRSHEKHEESPIPKVKLVLRNTSSGSLVYKVRIIERPMNHMPLNEVYPNESKGDVDSFEFVVKPKPMIDTNGCRIPIALVPYNRTRQNLSCGPRAVFFKKSGDEKIQATIKTKVMRKYLRVNGTFQCCYQFFTNPLRTRNGNRKTKYTPCKALNEGVPILLKSEFVSVQCYQIDNNTTYVIYKDSYVFVKKIVTPKLDESKCKQKYNVLIIGLDSMSLSRFEQTMRRTTKYLTDNYWLGYRAFNKIEADAFPNLIATLTGLDITDFSQKCENNMTICNDLFIWSKFKQMGYVTAFGEDYITLPEMFRNGYKFDRRPTDHYPRALFSNEEYIVNNSLVCAGKQSSGEQMLNYALDFAVTYRSESFFGLFWIHSLSNKLKSPMHVVDKTIENFLNQLSYTEVLSNTFVILMSAHGILVGETRLNPNSYYDERMPILFMLPATYFKIYQSKMYNSAIANQGRLVTPYDLYNTLVKIKHICDNVTIISQSCPKCQSLMETINPNRTCKDVGIHERWCTCRKMYYVDAQNNYGVKGILHVVSYMQSLIKTIETLPCWSCATLTLNKIIRMHFYYDESRTDLFYVVAFSMTPGDLVYEATVAMKIKPVFEVVGPVSLLSDSTPIGNCTIHQYTRQFCKCVRKSNC